MGKLFLFLVTSLVTLLGCWPFALLMWAAGCLRDLRFNEQWCIEAAITERGVRVQNWFPWMRGHSYSMNIGRLLAYHPDALASDQMPRTRKHEAVHVRQVEDASLVGLVIGAVAGLWAQSLWAFLLIWYSAIFWPFLYMLTACMRYGFSNDVAYRDAEHERSAYAQTDLPTDQPWDERRDDARKLTATMSRR